MLQIVSFIGFSTIVALFLSSRYHNERDELQPKWWYAVSAICAVCHLIIAFLIYKEYPILAMILFLGTCGLSYVTCKMAILHDRIDRIRKRLK